MQQHNRPPSQFIIGTVITFFLTGANIAQENTNWKDRFFAEAPKRWEDYLRFARSLQITATANRDIMDVNGKRSKISARSEFKQTKGACLYINYYEHGPKGETEVVGTNPSYSFKLKQRGLGRGWIITNLDVSGRSTTFSDEQRKLQKEHLQDLCMCLKLDHLWLPTLIHDSDFKITAIKTQEIDGRPVVRFDFDYPKSNKNYPVKGAGRIKGGWMVLDPEHDWILREYLVHAGQPDKYFFRQTFQIREGAGRHPIITHHTLQIVGKGEKPFGSTGEGEWQTVERSDVPLEEFTLSAFGLPEPPGTQVGRSRLHLWIALAGIVCLSIGALIRWQIRRTRMAG